MLNAVFRSVSQSVSRSVYCVIVWLCDCVIVWFYRIWWWVLISLFNVEFKVVGHECLMQFFEKSVNRLVGCAIVWLCDCVIVWFYRIWWWVLNSIFNAEFKVVGHECLMQSFNQSVNQLVGRSVVRLCDCVIVWLCDSIGSDVGFWIRYSMQNLNSWDMNA